MKSVCKNLETVSYFGPKVWEILAIEIKETESFLEFKVKIENWNPQRGSCRRCEVYFQHIRFI